MYTWISLYQNIRQQRTDDQYVEIVEMKNNHLSTIKNMISLLVDTIHLYTWGRSCHQNTYTRWRSHVQEHYNGRVPFVTNPDWKDLFCLN